MPFDFQPMRTKEQLISDPAKLLEDIKAYFSHCDKSRDERELKNGDLRVREETPSVLGLAQYLHTHRTTVNRLMDEDDSTQPIDDSLSDAQQKARDILTYAKQEMILRLAVRASNSDANDKVSQAMLARYGEIGEDKQNINLSITVSGASGEDVNSWSK